jgi:hypothetical protein
MDVLRMEWERVIAASCSLIDSVSLQVSYLFFCMPQLHFTCIHSF